MSLYLGANKFTGGYRNGQRINAYLGNSKIFAYSTTVQVNFSNGSSQTLNNVPLGNQNLSNYGLSAPANYSINGTTTFNITPNCSVSVSVTVLTTNVYVNFSSGGSQTLYNVPLGYQNLSSYGLSIPYGYTLSGTTSFNISSGSSVTVYTSSATYTAYITYTDQNGNDVGSDSTSVSYGNWYSPEDLGGYTLPSGYNDAGNNDNSQECTGDMYLTYYVDQPTVTVITSQYFQGNYSTSRSIPIQPGQQFTPSEYAERPAYFKFSSGDLGTYTVYGGETFNIIATAAG